MELYIDIGLCSREKDFKQQYAKLYSAMKDFSDNKFVYLDKYIDSNDDIMPILYFHSKFPDGEEINRNEWFRPYIRNKIFNRTIKEVREMCDIHPMPNKYLDMLKLFGPKQIPYERYPIEITYGFDQIKIVEFIDENGNNKSYNKRLDPINIEWLLWNFQGPVAKKEIVKKYIAEFEPIPCSNIDPHMDDDLPF